MARKPKGYKKPAGEKIDPYKFDKVKKEKYLELIRTGGRRHASARRVGVTPMTVITHMKDDPEFALQVTLSEIEADDEVEDALRTAAISGNVTAALAWLYSRQPERWRDERNLNVNFRKMNNDELRAYISERLSKLGFSIGGMESARIDLPAVVENDPVIKND